MADSPSSPATLAPNIKQPESDNPDTPSTSAPPPQDQHPATPNPNPNPNPNQPPFSASLPPPSMQPYAPPPQQPFSVPPTLPSYRPIPMPGAPQFLPVQNYQNPAVQVQPPGVGVSGGVAVTMAPPMMPYQVVPGQVPNMALRPYAPVPNGYSAVPAPSPV